jgi:ABC-type polysaccharide/polyol phosphate export permease
MTAKSSLQLAFDDVAGGLGNFHIWSALGWQDVKQRYRRSLLGPFWLTISTGIMVALMGPLYGKLFNQDFNTYFAFLAVGFVLWQLFAQTVNESCTAFITAEGYIKQVKLPLSIHILRIVWKNIVYFLHNMVVVVAVLLYLKIPAGTTLILFPLGLLAFSFNAFLIGMMLGAVCARFRDIPIIMLNLMQAAFFLTPIMWQPGMLGRYEWTVNLNPFHHFIEIMRAPLLGAWPNPMSWQVVGGITVIACVCALALLGRFRARVPYWV